MRFKIPKISHDEAVSAFITMTPLEASYSENG
jgi:hypothetical protein